jgi:hypothetical protein
MLREITERNVKDRLFIVGSYGQEGLPIPVGNSADDGTASIRLRFPPIDEEYFQVSYWESIQNQVFDEAPFSLFVRIRPDIVAELTVRSLTLGDYSRSLKVNHILQYESVILDSYQKYLPHCYFDSVRDRLEENVSTSIAQIRVLMRLRYGQPIPPDDQSTCSTRDIRISPRMASGSRGEQSERKPDDIPAIIYIPKESIEQLLDK